MPRPADDEHRHARAARRLVGLPGAVLFICLFMPAYRECGNPVTPLSMPPLWGPYLGGLIAALVAIIHHRHMRTTAVITLSAIWALAAGAIVAGMLGAAAPQVGVVAAIAAFVMIVALCIAMARRAWNAASVSSAITGHGLLSLCWGALLLSDRNHLYGATVTAIASAALVACGAAWMVVARRPPPPPEIPRAQASMSSSPRP